MNPADQIVLLSQVLQEFANKTSLRAWSPDVLRVPPQSHGYATFPPYEFLTALQAGIRHAKPLGTTAPHHYFCDIGCGPGITLRMADLAARMLSVPMIVEGIEIDQNMASFASGFTGRPVHTQDCVTFDYTRYNLIYLYRPLREGRQHERFTFRLLDTLIAGSVIISAGFDLAPTVLDEVVALENGRGFKIYRVV